MVFGKRNQPYFDGVVKSLEINKMDFKLYNPVELANSYQNLTMGPNVWGCYDPSGGVLMADKCLKAVWVFFCKKKKRKKKNCNIVFYCSNLLSRMEVFLGIIVL